MGSRAYRIIKDVLSPDAPTDVEFPALIERTSKHFQPEPSEIVQRFRFHTRVRESHESVATYIAQLKQIAGNCNFGETVRVNEMLRDRLVCGIANEKWQQRLLAEEGLTYDTARKLLLALEAAERGLKDLSVDALRKQVHYTQRRSAPRSTSQTLENNKVDSCKHCGRAHEPASCGLKIAECFFCHKRGHTAAVCRQKLRKAGPYRKKTNLVDTEEKPLLPPEYGTPMNMIRSVHSTPKKKLYIVDLTLHGKMIQMEVDTGATLSLMTLDTFRSTWDKSHAPSLKPSTTNLCTYTGQRMDVVGVVQRPERDAQFSDRERSRSISPGPRLAECHPAGLASVQQSRRRG